MLFEYLGWKLSLLLCLSILVGLPAILARRRAPVPASEADTGEWPAVRG